jgi:hypothetical protein
MSSFLSTLKDAAGAVSPIVGAGLSLLGSHKAQQASYEAIDRQNSFNEYMYNKYKNPVNASKLLLQAGINPAFAYGNIAGNMGSTPEQTAPADTSATRDAIPNAVNAFAQMQQSNLVRSQVTRQEIDNNYAAAEKAAQISKMVEETTGLKYDNYLKKSSQDMQLNILKQTEQQMYTKTYADNLLAQGSAWDLATKQMYARIGQPLQFQKDRLEIAYTAAQIAYQQKVNKWYDKMSKAQMDSLYTNAAAAIVGARASAQNAATNAKVGASQAANLDKDTFVKGQQNYRDNNLFKVTLQSLKLGVKQQSFETNLKLSTPGKMLQGFGMFGKYTLGSWSPLKF